MKEPTYLLRASDPATVGLLLLLEKLQENEATLDEKMELYTLIEKMKKWRLKHGVPELFKIAVSPEVPTQEVTSVAAGHPAEPEPVHQRGTADRPTSGRPLF